MKSEDIIKQLKVVLPEITDLFSDVFNITSLTYSAGLVTAVTDTAHNLSTGYHVNIVDATNPIDILSIERTGTEALVTTVTDHDLTLSNNDILRDDKTVSLSGATEAEFNGTFKLKEVLNSREFKIVIADAGAVTVTGSPKLEDGSVLPGFNGRHEITVVNTTTFTYPVTVALAAIAGGTPVVKHDVRVSGAVDIDTALNAYTEHSDTKLWAFVILGDVVASKNRNIQSDMIDTLTRTDGINQRIAQTFNILVIKDTSDYIGGLSARDLMEDVFLILNKSLVGVKFPTGLAASEQFIATFVEHGFNGFNTSYYTHIFSYEMAADITFEDTVGYDHDVAFREFDLYVKSDIDTQVDSITVLETKLEESVFVPPPGNSYAVLTGISGDYFSSPDSPILTLADVDIEIQAKVGMADWTPPSENSIISKFVATGNQKSFRTSVHPSGMQFSKSDNGSLTGTNALGPPLNMIPADSVAWIRWTFTKATGVVRYYYKYELEDAWIELTPSDTIETYNPFDSTAPLEVGTISNGTFIRATCDIYRAIVFSGIDGTPVADFDPNDYSGSGDSWVSSNTGEVWTIHGNASVVLQA